MTYIGKFIGYGISGGSSSASQVPPLPLNALEYWHSELQCSSASWVGQLGGRVLSGVNSPTVAVDPGFFNGRPVAKSVSSTSSYWRGIGFTGLSLAGSRPWLYMVGRVRDTSPTGGFEIIYGIGRSGVDDDCRFLITSSFLAARTGGFNVTGPAANTAVHRFEMWQDPTTVFFDLDASSFTNTTSVVLPANTNAVAIGASSGVGNAPSDSNVAFALLCSAKPTVAEVAAIDAWAQAYWGAP